MPRLTIIQGKKKGRHNLTAAGDKRRQSKHSKVHSAREKEPWLLATSLTSKTNLAQKVVKIYQ